MKDHLHIASGKILKRGLTPTPRHELCGAMPFRRNHRVAVPDHFFILPSKMSMWLNDQYGDCVTAEEAANKAIAGIFIQDSTVQTWCNANGTLNGANLQPVIQQMQTAGFSQDSNIYGDGNGLAINYADAPTLQAAIYQAGTGTPAGGIKIGIAADELPQGAGNANGWLLPNDSPDTNEDHCVALWGYGTAQQFVDAMNAGYPGLGLTLPAGVSATMQGYALYTWSTVGFVSTQAMVNMTGEAWIRTPNTTITGTGTPTPDSVYTTAGPTPIPPVPPVPPTPSPVGLIGSGTLADGTAFDMVPPGSVVVPAGGAILQPATVMALLTDIGMTMDQGIKIPPFLLLILKMFCGMAPSLPPPFGTILTTLCALLPANAEQLIAAGQSWDASPEFMAALRKAGCGCKQQSFPGGK